MRKILALSFAEALLIPIYALAQQSTTVIDNDQVKVLSVVVQPHQKTRLHEHKVNRVMIYLQPGTQDIIHQGEAVTKLHWSAGEALWSPASGMHTAEITSNNPVTIVEIELKKPASLSKMPMNTLDPVKLDPKDYKVAFQNPQVRVLRVKVGADQSVPLHQHLFNRVTVYLTDTRIEAKTKDGKVSESTHKAGDIAWATPTTHTERNAAGQPFELLSVELLQ